MMAVMIGIIMQVLEDGILSPSSVFFFVVAGQVVVTGMSTGNKTGKSVSVFKYMYAQQVCCIPKRCER